MIRKESAPTWNGCIVKKCACYGKEMKDLNIDLCAAGLKQLAANCGRHFRWSPQCVANGHATSAIFSHKSWLYQSTNCLISAFSDTYGETSKTSRLRIWLRLWHTQTCNITFVQYGISSRKNRTHMSLIRRPPLVCFLMMRLMR